MNSNRRSAVLYSLTAGAVAFAYAGDSAPDQRVALRPPRAAVRALAASAPSCPLPVGKQVKAVKAFAEMLPVFRHPRCLNCHGGVDPASPAHKGVDQLDPEIDRMANREAYEEQCQTCHDELPGWNTPGEPVFFIGKDDEELCKQMKRFENTGAKLVEHLDNDHHGIQFIAAGFAGDRALGEQGMVDHSVVRERPPGTQAQLVQQAQKWVDMLGDGYQASPECGCVIPKVKLKIRHTEEFVVPRGIPSKEASEVEFEASLTPMGDDKPNMFVGQVSLDRTIRLTLPRTCTGSSRRHERWVFYAGIDPASGAVKVWRSMFADQAAGGIECRHGAGTAKTGLFPSEAVSMLGFGEMVIPAGDSTRTERASELGQTESLTVTVIEVPAR